MLTPEQEQDILRRSVADPVWWMREVLGCEPWPVQAQIARAVRDHKRVVVPSCHSSGKSWLAARVALWWVLTHRDSLVITTAPTHRQVQRVLWREVRQAHRKARHPLSGKLPAVASQYEVQDGWMMLGFATDDPERFQGLHAPYILIVADEAPGIAEPIWEAIDGVMASGDARLLAIGNPLEASGPFWRMSRDGSAHRISISAYDTPNLASCGITQEHIASGEWEDMVGTLPYPQLVGPEWVAERYKRWGPQSAVYLSRVLGEFPQSATDALIPLSWVDRAQQSELEPDEPCVLGVDVARFGDAETVGVIRRGPVAEIAFASAQQDTMQTAGRVVAAIRKRGVSLCCIDEIGVGSGVVDRVRETVEEQGLRCRVVGLNSGERAQDNEQYANSRAEWWWGLRERFEAGEIAIPQDDELAAQLTALKFRYTSRGQVLIESKEDMRKRGLASPDRADALMLAFAVGQAGQILYPGSRPPREDDDEDDWRERRTWF